MSVFCNLTQEKLACKLHVKIAGVFQDPSNFYSTKAMASRHCLFSIGKVTTPNYNFVMKILSYVIESDLRAAFF